MPAVIRQGDVANGHTDIEGNAVQGTVGTASSNVKNGDIGIATGATIVSFPSHAHALSGVTPIDFRAHSVLISATGKHRINGSHIAIHGDTVPVADVAGGNATVVSSTTTLNCSA